MNTDRVLRTLDPAVTPEALDVARDRTAQDLLARITAHDTQAAEPAVSAAEPVAPRTRVNRRRVGFALAVTAAAAAVAVAAPGVLGGPAPAAAWTPAPSPLTAAETKDAAEACVGGFWDFLPGRQGPEMKTYVAERRGGWTLVYLATPDGLTEAVCMLRNGEPAGLHGQTPGGPGAEPVTVDADGAFGSIGGVMGNADESQRSSTGLVGADVVGLVLHTEAQGAVTATVNDGHYAAWWPDDPITEASENARTTPEFSHVTLTLRDGSTRQVRVDEFTGISMESLTTPDEGGSVQE